MFKFCQSDHCVLVCSSLSLSCLGLRASWTWLTVSFLTLGKFSAITSSNIFSGPFSLSFPSGTSVIQILVHLMLSQRSLRLSSFYFILFSIYSVAVISTILYSRSFIHSFALVIRPLIPSSVLFISVCLFFISSMQTFLASSPWLS